MTSIGFFHANDTEITSKENKSISKADTFSKPWKQQDILKIILVGYIQKVMSVYMN